MYHIVGTKIRKLRESMGLTQEQLAKSVGLSSEFISLLELGKRAPSLESLSGIATFFKKDIPFFMVEREEGFNLLMQSPHLDKKTKRVLKKFQNYADQYLQLEDLTGRRLNLAPVYTNITPERMAEQERRRLGLGDEPIRNVLSLLEINGLRILRHAIPADSNISGVHIFIELKQAAFALVDSNLPHDRQVFTAVHEYSHYLKDRFDEPVVDNPDIFVDEYVTLYHPRERFAQRFTTCFLMPRNKVKETVEKDLGKSRLDFDDVLYLKRYFGVHPMDMLNTLKEMDHISPTRWKEYLNMDADEREKVLFGSLDRKVSKIGKQAGAIVSERFFHLALDAYRKKKINKQMMAKLLSLSTTAVGSITKK